MDTFLAALKDLWNFVFGVDEQVIYKKSATKTLLIAPPINLVKLPESNATAVQAAKIPQDIITSPNVRGNFNSDKYYVTASPGLVFNRPVLSYDGVITKLPYATVTQVLAYEGRFARITLGESTGWVLKDDLTTQADEVFPELISGKVYLEDSAETEKLRKYIEDEFFTTQLFLSLQSTEFVTYQLKRQGLQIKWPAVRPRLAGTWQNILKGQNGIRIGLVPKTGAIIEYHNDDGTAFVGYTKAVKVDESIIIAGVGRQVVGEYREELIEKQEWQKCRPVWISVS
ncbi:MAG TPA: hypothetical protein PKA42_01775 [Candidatus Paceibacterota bacterium]|nr:hypothetical protein [Candidatus Paceibacterota bacterium]HMO82873.1 hypothetical protein [Candidatus Paceibacterota bacterium]